MSKFIFKHRFFIFIFLCLLLSANNAAAQTASISYQGKLNDGGVPANGVYDFLFKLYNVNGVQFSFAVPLNDVQVTNGVFNVLIPFEETPGIFLTGSQKFLEIAVRPGASTGAYTTLAPRQEFGSVPSAIWAKNANDAGTATYALNLIGFGGNPIPGNQFVITSDARLSDARNPLAGSANYIQNSTNAQATSNFNISGTGSANTFNAAQYNLGGERILGTGGAGSSTFLGTNNGNTAGTGFYNSFFGNATGRMLTSGNGNTFLGFQAGEATTTGSYNSIVGSGAGIYNQNGSFNSYFGASAGPNENSFNNLSFATAIGAFSRVVSSDTIVLGKTAGTYNNVTRPADTVKIPGALNVEGNVGIGTTAPADRLHVNGGNVRVTNGGIFIANPNTLVITSPNGACWGITVNNSGQLSAFSTACP